MYLLDDSLGWGMGVKVAVQLCTWPKISHCHHGNLQWQYCCCRAIHAWWLRKSHASCRHGMQESTSLPLPVLGTLHLSNPPSGKNVCTYNQMLWCQWDYLSHAEAEPEALSFAIFGIKLLVIKASFSVVFNQNSWFAKLASKFWCRSPLRQKLNASLAIEFWKPHNTDSIKNWLPTQLNIHSHHNHCCLFCWV